MDFCHYCRRVTFRVTGEAIKDATSTPIRKRTRENVGGADCANKRVFALDPWESVKSKQTLEDDEYTRRSTPEDDNAGLTTNVLAGVATTSPMFARHVLALINAFARLRGGKREGETRRLSKFAFLLAKSAVSLA